MTTLDRLTAVGEARRQLTTARRVLLLAILEARAAGATLQQVGDELGQTRQGARRLEAVARRTLGNGGK